MEDRKYPIKAYLYDQPELNDQIQYWSNDTDSCSVEIAFYSTIKDIFSLENKTVSIVVTKPDGTSVTAMAVVTGENTALWQLTTNELTVGINKATIQVYSGTERLTFGTFKYKVLVDPEGGQVGSENNYPILVQLINDVETALNSVSQTNENISQQELTRETNEENRVSAEVIRISNENTRVLNETDRINRFNEMTTKQQQDMEVVDARQGKTTLRDNIQDVKSQLADKARKDDVDVALALKANQIALNDLHTKVLSKVDKSYVDILTQSIASGSPKGVYPTVGDLNTAFPTGNTNVYVISADKNWYYWSGVAWTAGGVYNSTVLAHGSVSPEITNFLVTGKNLFNKNTITTGFTLGANGELVASAITGVFVSDFIKVKPSTLYSTNQQILYGALRFYDLNKTFISTPSETGNQFTTPANCYYIRQVSNVSGINVFQIEEGGAMTDYEEFYYSSPQNFQFNTRRNSIKDVNLKLKSVTPERTSFLTTGKNLLNKNNIVLGYSLNDKGELVSNATAGIFTSDFIKVFPSTIYSTSQQIQYGRIAYYDINKKYLGRATEIDYQFTTPADCEYIRQVSNTNILNTLQIELGSQRTPYESFYYNIPELKSNQVEKRYYPTFAELQPTITKIPNLDFISHRDREGVLWGVQAPNKIVKSIDEGVTFTTVIDITPFIVDNGDFTGALGFQNALIISDTGRIIIGTTNGSVYVSNEAKTTFTKAFQFSNGVARLEWGQCKYQNIILLSSYGDKNAANPPRQVYLSKDHGATWTKIFDMPIVNMVDPAKFHLHEVLYDPYSKAIWVVTGDEVNNNIYISYDFGDTWTPIYDTPATSTNKHIHPTSLLAFPHGVIMGSDELPEGMRYWKRPTDKLQPTIKIQDIDINFLTWGSPTDTNIANLSVGGHVVSTESYFLGLHAYRVDTNTTNKTQYARLFISPDGKQWFEVFREIASNITGFINLVPPNPRVKDKYVFATYMIANGEYRTFKAKLPDFIPY